MSKRFGRNQRRKMREQLADAKNRAVRAQQTTQSYADKLKIREDLIRHCEWLIDTIRDQVPMNSALLPPQTQDVSDMLYNRGWLETHAMSPAPRYLGRSAEISQPCQEMFSKINAYIMRGTVKFDRFSQSVHFFAQTPSGHVAYVMSAETLEELGPRDAVRHATKELMREFSIQLGATRHE